MGFCIWKNLRRVLWSRNNIPKGAIKYIDKGVGLFGLFGLFRKKTPKILLAFWALFLKKGKEHFWALFYKKGKELFGPFFLKRATVSY